MSAHPITVLKFGSSVLRTPADLPDAVHEIYREWRAGARVVAVVSALGSTTDRLLAAAQRACPAPQPRRLAPLLATGEAAAVQLLTLALARAGVPALALRAEETGLRAAGPPLDADPIGIDAARLHALLAAHPVLVLPGFVALDAGGEPVLLGRGGSDLSALYLAAALAATTCRLLKDVDGLYERDPAAPGPPPRRYAQLDYAHAAGLDGAIVQAKALRFAAARGLRFEVGRCGEPAGTVVGPGPARYAAAVPPRPVRVALLGLGTVGGGVFQELRRLARDFELVAVATARPNRPRGLDLGGIVPGSAEALLAADYDVLVELSGAPESAAWIREALQQGRDVVTAGKEVLVRHGLELQRLAQACGARLRHSASVGGALPALEVVHRLAAAGPIQAVEGVLSGTCNFVLERAAAGHELAPSVRRAQQLGLAEADPRADLDGTDSAYKLALLARAAFGVELDLATVARRGIDGLAAADCAAAAAAGEVLRLVASARRTADGTLRAEVAPQRLPVAHPLAGARGAENRLLVTPAHGAPELVGADGAGRWPTTEAVLADLLELRRRRAAAAGGAAAVEAAA